MNIARTKIIFVKRENIRVISPIQFRCGQEMMLDGFLDIG